MGTPFKMKGPSLYSSPMKQDEGKKKVKKGNELKFNENNEIIEVPKKKKGIKEIKGTSIFGNTPKEFVKKAANNLFYPWNKVLDLGKKK